MAGDTERIVVSDDGLSLPVIEILTGRGAIFGKSGSGKSNTASVVVEELLEKGFPVLIVDIEGEYATLTDRYDVVHVGDGDSYDKQLFEIDPGQIVDLCLDQHRPVIVDVSEVLELERAERVITDTLQLLFSREKNENKPFLVIVEEVHEFLPQQGGLEDLGEMLIRIAKRGRKRGLGLLGMSQRPASVDKNFITQCDWLVFHRLTWENDTRVVKTILGKEYADNVKDLATGAGFLLADWEESVREVRFRAKKTADAGDTPSLSVSERRDLTSTVPEREPINETARAEASAASVDESLDDLDAESDQDATATEPTVEDEDPEPIVEEETTEETHAIIEDSRESEMSTPEESSVNSRQATPDRAESEGFTTSLPEPESPPDNPSEKIVWELGQFVSFAVVRVIGEISYRTRSLVASFRGEPQPADRLGAVSVEGTNSPDHLSTFVMRMLAILLVVIALLVVFAFWGV